MKRISLILILFSAASVLFSQSVWTGNAAVSNEKEFESYYSEDSTTGKYLGASNSFPGSTEVTVTNPRNGKTVSVSIVKRLSQPGLFLVLSPEAGVAIDLPDDDILNVEVVVRRKNEEVFSKYSDDLPYSEDPDLNPSAELAPDSVFTEDTSADINELTAAKEVVTAPEPEIEAPVESSVNEYIPPVVLNSEGTPYEEGYDPLVLLDGEEETSQPGEVVEIVDDPVLLAESIMSTVSEPDIPLPDTYDENDLPDSYEPGLVGETAIESTGEIIGLTPESEALTNSLDNSLVVTEPELRDSELVKTGILEPESFDSEFMDTDIDDILFADSAEVVPAVEQPEIEEILIPEVAITEPGAIVTETFDPETFESVVMKPEVTEPTISDSEVAKPFVVEPIVIEPDVFESIVSDSDITEPSVIEPEISEPIVIAPEIIITDDLPVEEAPEKIITDDLPVEEAPENVIYFLTPGDFRPPPQSEEKKEKEKEKVKEKTIVALPVERTELEDMIVTELRNGGSYLQVGTYGSIEVLYSQIQRISDAYPSIVLTMGEEERQLYKLLIGPISRDEKGIIITRFRSMGYGDAFLYSPR